MRSALLIFSDLEYTKSPFSGSWRCVEYLAMLGVADALLRSLICRKVYNTIARSFYAKDRAFVCNAETQFAVSNVFTELARCRNLVTPPTYSPIKVHPVPVPQ